MKIFYITSKPIFPIVDGGCLASKSFLDCLIYAGIKIKHFTLSTEKHQYQINNYPSELQNKIQPESVHINTTVKPLSALAYLVKNGSYNVARFYSETANNKIIDLLSTNQFDAVILDGLYATPYLSAVRKHFKHKIFLRTHNVEHKIWFDLSKNNKSILKRLYFEKLANDLKKYELDVLKKLDGILTISNDDLYDFKELEIETPIKNIPVCISTEDITPHNYDYFDLFHIGSMSWLPNIEAVDLLLKLFQEIRMEIPNVRLHIAGSGASSKYKSNPLLGIYVNDFVDTIPQFIRDKGILASPIVSGSGVRMKLLEIMALGIPAITTIEGAKGIDKDSGLIIASNLEDFKSKVNDLVRDANLREKAGKKGQLYIRKKHDIHKISSELSEFIS